MPLWHDTPQLTWSHDSGAAATPVPSSPTVRLVRAGGGVMKLLPHELREREARGAREAKLDPLEAEQVVGAAAMAWSHSSGVGIWYVPPSVPSGMSPPGGIVAALSSSLQAYVVRTQ